jgi:hypothetical protein
MPKVNIQCGNSVFPTIPNLGLTPPITINIEEEEIEQIKKFGFKVDYLVEIEPEKPISTINITLKDDSIEIIDTPKDDILENKITESNELNDNNGNDNLINDDIVNEDETYIDDEDEEESNKENEILEQRKKGRNKATKKESL